MCTDKQRILDEIRKRADENGGVPMGWKKFSRVTGMRLFEWYGKYWKRWSEATAAAGLTPNTKTQRISDEHLFESLVSCIRELGRYPVVAELLIRGRNQPGFPSTTAFKNRFGNRPDIIRKLIDYCQSRPEDVRASYDDVLQICQPLLKELDEQPKKRRKPNARKPGPKKKERKPRHGYVYLFESAGLFKIGCSYDVLRRGRDLSWLLPDRGSLVHVIRTEDPHGIEAYWHSRFAGKRMHSEWFRLSPEDVHAFQKWREM